MQDAAAASQTLPWVPVRKPRALWRARWDVRREARFQQARQQARQRRARRRVGTAVATVGGAALFAAAWAGVPGAVLILQALASLVALVLILCIGACGFLSWRVRLRGRPPTTLDFKAPGDEPQPVNLRAPLPVQLDPTGPLPDAPPLARGSAWTRYLDVYALRSGGCDAIDRVRPAAPVDLARLEAALGAALPLELCEVLATIDGTTADDADFCMNYRLWSVQKMLTELHRMRQGAAVPDPDHYDPGPSKVKTSHRWRHMWLPIGDGIHHNLLLLDFDPDTDHGGVAGQVVEWYNETGQCYERAPSLAEFINIYTQAILDGSYDWHDDDGGYAISDKGLADERLS